MNILDVVIPIRNEESVIYSLLTELINQLPKDSKIIIADANSTDNSLNIIKKINDNRIIITNGGLPGVGRNSGATLSKSKYILFLDADIVLRNNTISNLINFLSKNDIDLTTTNILCKNGGIGSKLIYLLSNIFVYLSKLDNPFVVGGFFVINRGVFNGLGGFDIRAMHCEDYLLSKRVPKKKFKIMFDYVYTYDRRIKKMGYFGIIKYFIKNIINRNKLNYFYNDVNYWK